jgi:hypothetical protein
MAVLINKISTHEGHGFYEPLKGAMTGDNFVSAK